VADTLVAVGRVIGAHGLKGELKVVPLTDWPDRIGEIRSVYLSAGRGETGGLFEIEKVRGTPKVLFVKLHGIEDRKQAESLTGHDLRIRRSECAALPENAYYIFELKGLAVETADGGKIGTVVDILRLPAQDMLVVRRKREEILIPMVKKFVRKIDIPSGKITVEYIEGLL
jgi:16S rRNA processing protein RimM